LGLRKGDVSARGATSCGRSLCGPGGETEKIGGDFRGFPPCPGRFLDRTTWHRSLRVSSPTTSQIAAIDSLVAAAFGAGSDSAAGSVSTGEPGGLPFWVEDGRPAPEFFPAPSNPRQLAPPTLTRSKPPRRSASSQVDCRAGPLRGHGSAYLSANESQGSPSPTSGAFGRPLQQEAGRQLFGPQPTRYQS
jgi:hypothetical protein